MALRLRVAAVPLAVACAVTSVAPAQAHERSVSYADVRVGDEGAEITLNLDARDLTRIPDFARGGSSGVRAAAAAIASGFVATKGSSPCRAEAPPLVVTPAPGRTTLRWRVRCDAAGPIAIESRLPSVLDTPHLCFAKISGGGGVHDVVLYSGKTRWQEPASPAEQAASTPAAVFADAFRVGVAHIASGADHLGFLLGLLVVASTLAEVAIVITAFTLAHTLTLAVAAFGLARPATPCVEALIAVSIAMIAIENLTLRSGSSASPGRRASVAAGVLLAPALVAAALHVGRVPLAPLAGVAIFSASYLAFAERRPEQRRVRWLVAFAFGLLHGFGFAGALVQAGFSGATAALTLAGFNAGVEGGQFLFVAMVWPLLVVARRRDGFHQRFAVEPVSVALLAASVAWYATRAFG